MTTDFVSSYLRETADILAALDRRAIGGLVAALADLKARRGRLFILGVGGSAGHAGHAVNDFRKLCGIEAYAPTDNVSELTARTNDEGWDTTFAAWLRGSHLRASDAILIFSVGGGNVEKRVSVNIVAAIDEAKGAGATVLGIVGRDGGYTAQKADAAVVVPPMFPDRVTPHTEGLCAVLWHLLVSHPDLQEHGTRWEAVAR